MSTKRRRQRRVTAPGRAPISECTWSPPAGPDAPHVIALGPEDVSRPPLDVLLVTLHAFVHQANHEAGLRDLEPDGYHNEHFQVQAEAIGLRVEHDPKGGWCRTSLTPALRRQLLEDFRPDFSKFPWVQAQLARPAPSPSPPAGGRGNG